MVPRKVVDKYKPHYNLNELKSLIREGRWIATQTAVRGAVSLGLSPREIEEIVLNLEYRDFYKSMTSYMNHKLWQDVYKPKVFVHEEHVELYVKLQKSPDEKCVVISFKRSEDPDNV